MYSLLRSLLILAIFLMMFADINMQFAYAKKAPVIKPQLKTKVIKKVVKKTETKTNSQITNVTNNTTVNSGIIKTNKVVKTVNQVESKLKYTHYRLGGNRFDIKNGVFLVDCSTYVDNVLRIAKPQAYKALSRHVGTPFPNSLAYYNFTNKLSAHDVKFNWQRVDNVSNLKPGDILIFRYKHPRRRIAGHVMIVMQKPKLQGQNIYKLRVADSSPFRHSHDTRKRSSGVGQGDMLLKVNKATKKPLSYSWKVDYGWSNEMLINMARPA